MSDPWPPLMDWSLDGTTLVEAGAGTGKTWTITGLYLRLLLEAALPVESILVVTFTEAAKEELRGRIRNRLVDALEVMQTGESDDPLCRALYKRIGDHGQAAALLEQALSSFDLAAVQTIHGFCLGILGETAFETKTRFEAEVITSQQELLAAIHDDFWRLEIASEPDAVLTCLARKKITPDTLHTWLAAVAWSPAVKVLLPPPEKSGEYDLLLREGGACLARIRAVWQECRDQVAALVAGESLKKNIYRPATVRRTLADVDRLAGSPTFTGELPEKMDKLTPAAIEGATKKGHTPVEHPFFHLCAGYIETAERFTACLERRVTQLKGRFHRFVAQELARRKEERVCHYYDDFLQFVHAALREPGPIGEQLAQRVRARFRAVMIDEFQDTDQVQLEIFQDIYSNGNTPRFLVGDPKQAIYSFRGADVFCYLKGRKDADRTHSLTVNHRSDPLLVRAVHGLFESHPRPFFFKEFAVTIKVEGHEKNRGRLVDLDAPKGPLRFFFLPRDGKNKPISKQDAGKMVIQGVVLEIGRMLAAAAKGRCTLDGKPVGCGDMAVLVRTHRQAGEMEKALRQAGIPSVRQGEENVFHSPDAAELEAVLAAVAEPRRERLLRAALATRMLGYDAAMLQDHLADPGKWEVMVARFTHYHELWRDRGFMPMLTRLLDDFNVFPRLLQLPDGERKATNLRHLAELLQQRAAGNERSMHLQLRWLARQRNGDTPDGEETLLRLESDARRVKIVTIHKAKGLEYPVVFCPFLWDGTLRAEQDESFLFHDPDKGYDPFYDMGSDALEQHRQYAVAEELSESVRLLYVALTRAACRCSVFMGAVSGYGASPLAWLLHYDPSRHDGRSIAAITADLGAMDDAGIIADLEKASARAAGGIAVFSPAAAEMPPSRPPATGATETPLAVRSLSRTLKKRLQVASFTGLYGGGHRHERAAEALPAAEEKTVFSFPRGARTGTCWHTLFENLDFPRAHGEHLDQAVATALSQAGFDLGWQPVVAAMVRNTLAVVLDDAPVLRLAEVTRRRSCREMEFFFSVRGLEASGLRRMVRRHGGPMAAGYEAALAGSGFGVVTGYLHGFIDLVVEHAGRYYLIDYKSTFLGHDPALYVPDLLQKPMTDEGYFFQSLLYTVAVHRYLQQRLAGYSYEEHFGGVYYLFLRGITDDPACRSGVFFDRPPAALIDALHAFFAGGSDHG